MSEKNFLKCLTGCNAYFFEAISLVVAENAI